MLHFSGCDLFEPLEIEQTISGHIFIDCDMKPLKNYTIQFYGGGGGGGGGVVFTTTTDENGYFYANFKNKYPELSIQNPQNFGQTLFDLDSEESQIDRDFIIFETGRLQIKVQTMQSYTDQDTLYLDYRQDGVPTKMFVGPFENNQTVEDLELRYYENFEDDIIWGLGWDDYTLASQIWWDNRNVENYQYYNHTPFEIGGCGTVTEVVILLP